jgi:hypothetical protein
VTFRNTNIGEGRSTEGGKAHRRRYERDDYRWMEGLEGTVHHQCIREQRGRRCWKNKGAGKEPMLGGEGEAARGRPHWGDSVT